MIGGGLVALGTRWASVAPAAEAFEVVHTDAEWRKLLTPAQFAILRQSATERPFSSPLLHEERAGYVSLCGMRPRPVFFIHKIRQWDGMAKLLGAA